MQQDATTAVPVPLGRPIRRRLGRRLLGVAALVVVGSGLALHHSVVQYKVTSGSMEPTLQVGQQVGALSSGRPVVGDIVLFHPPAGARANDPVCGSGLQGSGTSQPCDAPSGQETDPVFVKRVVAGPGDSIAIVDGHAVRNGARESDPYIAPCGQGTGCNFPTPVTVPAGEYYVLGDNRGVSDDSRFWGPVPAAWIIGIVVHCSLLDTFCHPVR